MYLTQKLSEYYGKLGDSKIKFIYEHTSGLKDKQLEVLFEQITKEYPSKTEGLPDDEEKLLELLSVKKKANGVVWSHCEVCGSEYDYKFMFCPVCYRNEGVKRNEFYVITSEEFPPKVIRYNCVSEPMNNTDANCLKCKIAAEGNSYCRLFGNYVYRCKMDEFRDCPCKQCCAIAKKANQKFDELKAKLPLDKIGNKVV